MLLLLLAGASGVGGGTDLKPPRVGGVLLRGGVLADTEPEFPSSPQPFVTSEEFKSAPSRFKSRSSW